MLLFCHIDFSFAIAVEVCAILERISDFDPSSDSVLDTVIVFFTLATYIKFYM